MGVQTIELIGVLLLLGMTTYLLRRWLSRLRDVAPLGFDLAIAVGAGLSGAILVLVLQGDLFPDRFEGVGRTVLFIGLAGEALLIGLLAWTGERM